MYTFINFFSRECVQWLLSGAQLHVYDDFFFMSKHFVTMRIQEFNTLSREETEFLRSGKGLEMKKMNLVKFFYSIKLTNYEYINLQTMST